MGPVEAVSGVGFLYRVVFFVGPFGRCLVVLGTFDDAETSDNGELLGGMCDMG